MVTSAAEAFTTMTWRVLPVPPVAPSSPPQAPSRIAVAASAAAARGTLNPIIGPFLLLNRCLGAASARMRLLGARETRAATSLRIGASGEMRERQDGGSALRKVQAAAMKAIRVNAM